MMLEGRMAEILMMMVLEKYYYNPCDGSHGMADHRQVATLIEMKY